MILRRVSDPWLMPNRSQEECRQGGVRKKVFNNVGFFFMARCGMKLQQGAKVIVFSYN